MKCRWCRQDVKELTGGIAPHFEQYFVHAADGSIVCSLHTAEPDLGEPAEAAPPRTLEEHPDD